MSCELQVRHGGVVEAASYAGLITPRLLFESGHRYVKMMKMKIAHLGHQIDEGSFITIAEVSLTDLILQYYIGDELFGFLNWLHRDWMYSIRWGKIDPEYEIAEKSLGSKLFALAQWAGNGFGAYRRERDIAHLPVSSEWVREHFPNAGWPWDGSELDEMESKAGDDGDVIL